MLYSCPRLPLQGNDAILRLVAFVLSVPLAGFATGAAGQAAGLSGRASHGSLQVGIRIASAGASEDTFANFLTSRYAALRSSRLSRVSALAAPSTPHPERTL